MMKLTVLFGILASASCTILHQAPQPIPVVLSLQYHDTPNYNFAYEVNDAHTGDVKSQHESRRGETVQGQYTLLQPDGVRRTVDYRADEHVGFRATVNNEGRTVDQGSGYSNGRNLNQGNGYSNGRNLNQGNGYSEGRNVNQGNGYSNGRNLNQANGYSNDVETRSNAVYEGQSLAVQQPTQLPSNIPAHLQGNIQISQPSYLWPAPTAAAAPTPAPVAVSRSSFVQTFSHSNPWA